MGRIEPELPAAFYNSHHMLKTGIVTRSQPFETMFENTGQLIGNRDPDGHKNKDEDQRPQLIVFKQKIKENDIQRNPDPRAGNQDPEMVKAGVSQIIEKQKDFLVFLNNLLHPICLQALRMSRHQKVWVSEVH